MSYQSTLLTQCEDLQDKLVNVFGKDGQMPNDPIPFLQFLRSEQNTNGVNMLVNPGEGKTKNVNLTYFQRLGESTVTEASERGCDVGETRGNCVKQYTIDTTDLLQSSERIKASDLARFCESNPQYLAEVIARHMNVIDRRVATKTANEAAALLGGYSADAVNFYGITNDILTVSTKASNEYVIGAFERVSTAARMSSFNGFLSFGGAAMQEYLNITLSGCCSNQGIDVRDIYDRFGYAFMYDRRLATALGSAANANLIMEPGALQLLMYTETPWKDGMQIEFNSGYAAFPFTTAAGVEVDVYIKDNCPGNVDINVFANTRLVGLPDDLFPVGDNFSGVNYVAQVNVSNS